MEPRQWRNELPPELREVLHTGIAVNAPTGTKQAVWNAVSAKLAATSLGASAGGVTALTILKPLAIGLAVGAVTAVSVVEIRSATTPTRAPSAQVSPQSQSVAPSRVISPKPREISGPVTAELPPSRTPKAAITPSPADVAPRVASAEPSVPISEMAPNGAPSGIAAFPDSSADEPDATVLEGRRLNRARAALQAGDARAALTQLDAIAADFPNGVLGQERDALRTEALLGIGDRARARELAQRFLARYPQSPHAASVERALH
jgi:hypothetical protein